MKNKIKLSDRFIFCLVAALLGMLVFTSCTQDDYSQSEIEELDEIPIEDYERHTSYTVTHKDWGYDYPYGIPEDCPEFDVETTGGYYFVVDNEDGFYIAISKEKGNGEYADGASLQIGMTDEKMEERIEKAIQEGMKVSKGPERNNDEEEPADDPEKEEQILLGDSGYLLTVYDYDNIVPKNVKITVHE
jgi:hypothetical protein